MSTSKDNSHKLPSNLNLHAYSFFDQHTLENWTLENYYHFYKRKISPSRNYNTILRYYSQDIEIIRTNKNVDEGVRRATTALKNSVNEFKKGKSKAQTVNNNVDTNYGIVVGVMNDPLSSGDSKLPDVRQTNHLEETVQWQIEDEEDIWDAWRQFLQTCNCYGFCLEKYHIIECGYSIKCSPSWSDQLLDHLGVDDHSVESAFKRCSKYAIAALLITKDIIMTNYQEKRKALMNLQKNEDEDREAASFVEEFLLLIVNLCRHEDIHKPLSQSEPSFNFRMVWPLMSLACEASSSCLTFLPGEYILKASKQDYKADACIVDAEQNELCILETSDPLKLDDKCEYGYDYVKGAFGSLTLFNDLFKKYYMASKDTAQRLNVIRGFASVVFGALFSEAVRSQEGI
ncbi:uncharacterized protein RHIMIDRAFT_283038 [Rhizopus microsporus ATCC 52813]|uniref:Uncharacterized protein n=1 Tax=Rhizopus microsporus ATCC 52813 TaxID=1340429 RepID=A0A2G4SWF4_RHIZD|nr:uncharacterized protein RHIMIDRAFT_283038 [Rhizopus microsporus ATCC 52813]PHZ12696.1 hypothetical protein RHIMIDRAFT_283038 [Rhizopus microsporus ATCC 52813]